jgi:Flp pilus assembly protein TadG
MSVSYTGGRSARSRARSDRGQATVELALVLPLVFGLLVLVFQIALVARDEVLVVHAARDAAREATVTRDATRVASAGRRNLPGAMVRVVRRGRVGESVEVAITYVSRTDLPLVGALLPDLTLHGRSVMRVETP